MVINNFIPVNNELILRKDDSNLVGILSAVFKLLALTDEIVISVDKVSSLGNGEVQIEGSTTLWSHDDLAINHITFRYEALSKTLKSFVISRGCKELLATPFLGFSFHTPTEHLSVEIGDDDNPNKGLLNHEISANLTFDSISIPVSMIIRGDRYDFEADFSAGNIPSLSDLATLIGGDGTDLKTWLPQDFEGQSTVEVISLSASLDLEAENKLKNISLELGFGTDEGWEIVEGFSYLRVGDLKARLEVDEPLSTHRFAQVHLSGALFLGSPQNPGRVDLGVRWPDLAVTGRLATGDNIELAWLLGEIGIPVVGPTSGDKALKISELSFSAEPDMVPKSFAFSMAVDNLWSISLNGRELFSLQQISMRLASFGEGDDTQREASFGANMLLGGNSFSASAQSNDQGWAISAWSNDELKPLVWINQLMGNTIDLKMPDKLDDLALSSARVSYDTGSGQFSLEGSIEEPWTIPKTSTKLENLFFSISHSPSVGFQLAFSGQITIKGVPNADSEVIISVGMNYESGNWSLSGDAQLDNIDLKDLAEKLIPDATEIEVPDLFEGKSVTQLGATYSSADNKFEFTTTVEAENFPFDGKTSELRLELSSRLVDGVKRLGIKGNLVIEDDNTGEEHKFLMGFASQQGEKSFLATYQGETTLKNVLALFSEDVSQIIPEWVTPTMKGAQFLMSPSDVPGKKPRMVFAIEGSMDFDLGKLELAGKFIGNTAISVNSVIQISSEPLNPDEVDGIQTLLADVIPDEKERSFDLPDAGLGKGFSVDLSLGGDGIDKILQNTSEDARKFKFSQVLEAQTGADDAGEEAAPGTKTQWKKSKKKFGPVFINKIGATLEDGGFKMIIDGGMTLGGFTFALLGLGVKVPLKKPYYPDFSIEGLGLDYRAGKLHMTGAFLAQDIVDDFGIVRSAYMGEAQLTVGNKSFKAIGSYVDLGDPSFFLFAVVTIPIGGPSYFFVTGFAAGFGINSSLNIPPIDDVRNFIFLKAAFNETKFDDANPGANLALISEQIPPRLGSYWLAVGLKVSHVVVLESFFLATVEFGKRLEINLLGLSRLNLPPPGKSVAKIEMALRARFVPDEGFLSIEGRISPGSYVINPLARLGGGFAFYSWFKDQPALGISAGDFVMSMGGYHPRFTPPAHYPVVPRLSLSWQLSSNIIIKGQMYYALTPDVMMAGGRLEAKLDLGAIQAWFNAEAHFIVHFSPFKYNANISVSMGASLEIDLLLVTVRISISFSAQLELWGPEFGGYAEVDLAVVEFEVEFGAGRPAPPPLLWPEFQQKFLPKPEETVQTTVALGLVKDISSTSQHHGLDWILNPNELKLNLETPIPFRTFEFDGKVEDENWSMGVAPMHLSNMDSEITVKISKGQTPYNDDDFIVTGVKGAVPKAYWATSRSSGIPNGDASLIKNVYNGLTIVPAADVIDVTEALDVKKLLRDILHFEKEYDKHDVAMPDNNGTAESTDLCSPEASLINNKTLEEFGIGSTDEFTFSKLDRLLLESDPVPSRTGAPGVLELIDLNNDQS